MRLYALFALLTAIDWVSAVTLRSSGADSLVLGMTLAYALAIAASALSLAIFTEGTPIAVLDDMKRVPRRTMIFILVLGFMYACVRYLGDHHRGQPSADDVITKKNIMEMAIAAIGYTIIAQRRVTFGRLAGVALLPIAAWLID